MIAQVKDKIIVNIPFSMKNPHPIVFAILKKREAARMRD